MRLKYKLICIIIFIFFILLILLKPNPDKARPKAKAIACRANLKRISIALHQYAAKYNDYFPPYNGAKGLNLLLKESLISPKDLICPASNLNYKKLKLPIKDSDISYAYYGGFKASLRKEKICEDKKAYHYGFKNVLYTNSIVKMEKVKRK